MQLDLRQQTAPREIDGLACVSAMHPSRYLMAVWTTRTDGDKTHRDSYPIATHPHRMYSQWVCPHHQLGCQFSQLIRHLAVVHNLHQNAVIAASDLYQSATIKYAGDPVMVQAT